MCKPELLKAGIIAVTGGSRGVGAAISEMLLLRGFRVGCLSRSGNSPVGINGKPALCKNLITLPCDVTVEADLAKCFESLDNEAGGLRALVNNAGIHSAGASASFASSDFEMLLRTNTVAVFAGCREAYPYLKKAGGVIINIGSVFESLGTSHNACYSASKAAISALTRSLACEWARDGIVVLNVAPGYVATDLNTDYLARDDVRAYFARQAPIGRPTRSEEIGALVASLLATDLTLLTGQTIRADGGHSIAHGNIR